MKSISVEQAAKESQLSVGSTCGPFPGDSAGVVASHEAVPALCWTHQPRWAVGGMYSDSGEPQSPSLPDQAGVSTPAAGLEKHGLLCCTVFESCLAFFMYRSLFGAQVL